MVVSGASAKTEKKPKIIWALKIKAVNTQEDGGAYIIPVEDVGGIRVSKEFLAKHKPKVGGCLVKYHGEPITYSAEYLPCPPKIEKKITTKPKKKSSKKPKKVPKKKLPKKTKKTE